MNWTSIAVLQIFAVFAALTLMVSADGPQQSFNRRQKGWTTQAKYLYGIFPRSAENAFNEVAKRTYRIRPNIIRSWDSRLSRRSLDDQDDEVIDKRSDGSSFPLDNPARSWQKASLRRSGEDQDDDFKRLDNTAFDFNAQDKRVPEQAGFDLSELPMLKRLDEMNAFKRDLLQHEEEGALDDLLEELRQEDAFN